jgi:hypothetical protein
MAVIQWSLVFNDEVGWAVGAAQISTYGLNFLGVYFLWVTKL